MIDGRLWHFCDSGSAYFDADLFWYSDGGYRTGSRKAYTIDRKRSVRYVKIYKSVW